ncbi:hypothetical protein, partial [Faecalibaculum rodentium]|uniref:hypothetical protein n=1 Tax=Faecalibaculum rodentium TaxID=1702221 RepID=UPI0026F3F4CE
MVDAFCGSGLWPYFSRTQKAIVFSRTCTVMQAGRADGFFLFLFVQCKRQIKDVCMKRKTWDT